MLRRMIVGVLFSTSLVLATPGQTQQPDVDRMVRDGIAFLESRGQAESGAFGAQEGTGITSLCITAILEHRPAAANERVIQNALSFLEKNVQPDGGVYVPGSLYRNYETCLAIMAFEKANASGKYDEILKGAEAFVKRVQWDEGEGLETSDLAYGGAGYAKHDRPDLSNTAFLIDALHQLGRGEEDPAIQKALLFVSRCQNLASDHNQSPFAAKVNDGGFYYTVAAGGQSQAGQTPDGGLRSYGSMTYAGLKSMLYAGVSKDDRRVQAALDFIRKNYSLEQNPGMGYAGLFYYYQTFAKALAAAEIDTLEDSDGVEHDWRAELQAVLAELQKPDGAWVNERHTRWLEGDRELVTAYALLALAYSK